MKMTARFDEAFTILQPQAVHKYDYNMLLKNKHVQDWMRNTNK